MSKRVSNKKGTRHREGVKPARSTCTWKTHNVKVQRRRRAAVMEAMRQESRANIARRFKTQPDLGSMMGGGSR